MKKVVIIGCPGAGKSTFGRNLAAKTGLPLFYLDMLWHKPDRTTITREEFDEKLTEIMALPKWIIDGNYKRTLPKRLAEADTVFFLDYPLDLCLAGAIERLGKDRPDIPWEGRDDRELDPEFRQWILDYPKDQLPIIRALLAEFPGTIHIFHSRSEATLFLSTI